MSVPVWRRRLLWLSCSLVVAFVSSADAPAAENWPQFRGPTGQGHSVAQGLPLHWSETENVAWKTLIPDQGWSSPVIFGNQIWLTSAHASTVDETSRERRLQGSTNSQPLAVADNLTMYAICVDKRSGQLRHTIRLMAEPAPDPIHTLNTYASPHFSHRAGASLLPLWGQRHRSRGHGNWQGPVDESTVACSARKRCRKHAGPVG